MTFYHYTCDHGREGIGDYGVVRSIGDQRPEVWSGARAEDVRLMYALIWVTDLPEPDILGLGLTSSILSCERWRHRYRITNDRPVWKFTDIQYRFSPARQMDLLSGDAQPEHWFVSWRPLPAVYDPAKVSV